LRQRPRARIYDEGKCEKAYVRRFEKSDNYPGSFVAWPCEIRGGSCKTKSSGDSTVFDNDWKCPSSYNPPSRRALSAQPELASVAVEKIDTRAQTARELAAGSFEAAWGTGCARSFC